MLDQSLRAIVNANDENFRPYDRYGDPVPGMHWVSLSGEPGNGGFECFLLRMDPGATSKPHEHTGHEEFLIQLHDDIAVRILRLTSTHFILLRI